MPDTLLYASWDQPCQGSPLFTCFQLDEHTAECILLTAFLPLSHLKSSNSWWQTVEIQSCILSCLWTFSHITTIPSQNEYISWFRSASKALPVCISSWTNPETDQGSFHQQTVDPPPVHRGHHFRWMQIASQHLPEGTGRLMWRRGDGVEWVFWSRLKAVWVVGLHVCECVCYHLLWWGGFHLSSPLTSEETRGSRK